MAAAALGALGVPAAALADKAPVISGWSIRDVHVKTASDGRGVNVLLDATVRAPASAVEQVVADLRNYPYWVPGFRAVRMLSSASGQQIFETDVDLPWPMRDVSERLVMKREAIPGGVRYAWTQLHGDLRRNDGSWTVTAEADGHTRVVYRANFQMRSWVPVWLIRMAEKKQAPTVVRNLQERARFYI